MPNFVYPLLLFAVSMAVAGQLLLKWAATASGGISALLSWRLIVALGCYGLGAISYVLVLRHMPLSLAYPTTALGYVFVAYLSHRLWGEPFGFWQVAGIALIACGVAVLHLHRSVTAGS